MSTAQAWRTMDDEQRRRILARVLYVLADMMHEHHLASKNAIRARNKARRDSSV